MGADPPADLEHPTSWTARATEVCVQIAIQQDALIDLLGVEQAQRLPLQQVLREAAAVVTEALRLGVRKDTP